MAANLNPPASKRQSRTANPSVHLFMYKVCPLTDDSDVMRDPNLPY